MATKASPGLSGKAIAGIIAVAVIVGLGLSTRSGPDEDPLAPPPRKPTPTLSRAPHRIALVVTWSTNTIPDERMKDIHLEWQVGEARGKKLEPRAVEHAGDRRTWTLARHYRLSGEWLPYSGKTVAFVNAKSSNRRDVLRCSILIDDPHNTVSQDAGNPVHCIAANLAGY